MSLFSSVISFTFHYVSINSKRRKRAPLGLTYLHSTMYLLIRDTTNGQLRTHTHLHSTMYLLIPAPLYLFYCLVYDLHSTMYLLILVTPNSTYFKPSTPTFCRPNISYSYYLTKFLTILSNK